MGMGSGKGVFEAVFLVLVYIMALYLARVTGGQRDDQMDGRSTGYRSRV
jgi:hypothetical protein